MEVLNLNNSHPSWSVRLSVRLVICVQLLYRVSCLVPQKRRQESLLKIMEHDQIVIRMKSINSLCKVYNKVMTLVFQAGTAENVSLS